MKNSKPDHFLIEFMMAVTKPAQIGCNLKMLFVVISLIASGNISQAQYESLLEPTGQGAPSDLPATPVTPIPAVTPKPLFNAPDLPALPVTPIEPALPIPNTPEDTVEAIKAPEAMTESIVTSVTEELSSESTEPEKIIHWYYPSYWFGPTPWDNGFEIGLNGASGTSDSFSMRTGGFIKRKGKDYKLDASLYYNKNKSEGIEVQSNALLDVRYDWLFDDSPWSLFVLSQTFYDEFQAFDLNVNVNAGIGYQFIDTESLKFASSFGSGASREFGGPNEEWVPEASFGLNYEQYISKTRKLYAKMDYFPEWENFNNYRILADVGLEIELVQPSNLSLKFSATDRYDSQPDGVDPHNLNYSVLLIWKN